MPTDNRILSTLLDRLLAALVNGPGLNCRPHNSRQRIDLTQLAKLGDRTPEQVLRALLGPDRKAKLSARVPPAKGPADQETTDAKINAARQAHRDQQTVLGKLRTIAEDARTYENDTGVHVLQIGFPLLSLPPEAAGQFGLTRRVLAPLAFVSLNMTVRSGLTPSVALECRNDGADLVVPNAALLSWLEQQTGKPIGDLFDDETGERPWSEIVAIAERVAALVETALPSGLAGEAMPDDLVLVAAPRSDAGDAARPTVLPAAVIGLYPMANQGLLRDTQALVAGEPATGPIEHFIRLGVSLDAAPGPAEDTPEPPPAKHHRVFAEERFVTAADPCQARAVRLARTSRGLVVHGPPGTGKSQTIANVLGDHLARGERVLFVCDKRTALDVVMNRLDGMGLGGLCAVVHDPQRDQRDVYRSVREQIDGLAETRTDATAEAKLTKIDQKLQALHDELTAYHAALMIRPDVQTPSLHELIGRWLAGSDRDVPFDTESFDARPEEVDTHAVAMADVADRAAAVAYPSNPWTTSAGLPLDDYLSTPLDTVRKQTAALCAACEAADAALDPTAPPLPPGADLEAIAVTRANAAVALAACLRTVPSELRENWAAADRAAVLRASDTLTNLAGPLRAFEAAESPGQADLAAAVRDAPPAVARMNADLLALDAYHAASRSIFGFLAFGKKSTAAAVLASFGLPVSTENATKVREFLIGLKTRRTVRDALAGLSPPLPVDPASDDAAVVKAVSHLRTLLDLLLPAWTDPHLADIGPQLVSSVGANRHPVDLLRSLEAAPDRAADVRRVEKSLEADLFGEAIRANLLAAVCGNQPVLPTANALIDAAGTLENVLRVRHGLVALPPALRVALTSVIEQGLDGAAAVAVLRRAADGREIARRLKADRTLTAVDDQKLQTAFARYQELDSEKVVLARQAILHLWTTRQKARLLNEKASRVSSLGADLRRRFVTRGERATRLRQVVQMGQATEGGDPLFDLRPIWMASPETVAQLFPRKAVFDTVVFDEASQCRLEEALPVMLRAGRVVIAGDPKQLPPTRFFESALTADDDESADTDQQLFERQQAGTEDLLAAALNIEIDECYLDVHYRSRHADLIGFSNEQFYGSRLQPIPARPGASAAGPPITLHAVGGTYTNRTNAAEAERVLAIVRELLARPEPPSVGIACFNVAQRDLILEKLEDAAAADAAFGKAFAAARERHTASAFDGLFVKNLENVQGDERDHLIISTTYGPDAAGKFYRRFGPIGLPGGGRRLNVLVTRARDHVHVVTSIPETAYRSLPPVPSGESPGGAWLLFAYLAYAERVSAVTDVDNAAGASLAPALRVWPSRFPSAFAETFGGQLHDRHGLGVDVHWGNDGFCVDLAVRRSDRPAGDALGVLCDLTRYAPAADAIEWDAFRAAILTGQGWTLRRISTPHFFRDPGGVTDAVVRAARGP